MVQQQQEVEHNYMYVLKKNQPAQEDKVEVIVRQEEDQHEQIVFNLNRIFNNVPNQAVGLEENRL